MNLLSKNKTIESKSWKVSLRKAYFVNGTYMALPGSQHSVSFFEKKNAITVKTAILKSERFLQASDLTSINYSEL